MIKTEISENVCNFRNNKNNREKARFFFLLRLTFSIFSVCNMKSFHLRMSFESAYRLFSNLITTLWFKRAQTRVRAAYTLVTYLNQYNVLMVHKHIWSQTKTIRNRKLKTHSTRCIFNKASKCEHILRQIGTGN